MNRFGGHHLYYHYDIPRHRLFLQMLGPPVEDSYCWSLSVTHLALYRFLQVKVPTNK